MANQGIVTRESELHRVLGEMAKELSEPDWVALVDHNGLIMACIPEEPAISTDSISAMTAAAVMMGDRVLREIDGGGLRFVSIAGSNRQQVTVILGESRHLSIAIRPEVPAQQTFGPLSRWVPELIKVLTRDFGEAARG
jgi:predicted regulator of Ras-like GTPase activity (Roadblock/LC7/MglB family)